MKISGNFERFQYFNFEADFLRNENFFQKTGVPIFSWKHSDFSLWVSLISHLLKKSLMENFFFCVVNEKDIN